VETFYEFKPQLAKQSACALGFFDGVHPGHRAVIAKAVEEAKQLGATPALVTFKDHPRAITRGAAPYLLTTLEQRLYQFEKIGIELALVLSFNEEICQMSPGEYIEQILIGALGVKSVSVGQNHYFGRNREGNVTTLREAGKKLGFAVHVAPMIMVGDSEVSSSRIRNQVLDGNVEAATKLLGRAFAMPGLVVKGAQMGRKLGFPTANLQVSPRQVIPASGVYATLCTIDAAGANKSASKKYPAVVNIGYRPTISDSKELTIEAHLLNFNADLYGQEMTIEFIKHLRAEMKFEGLEALKEQIGRDCQSAENYFQCK
jgi:riboflavin kinase/FMN adenylyltransferase